MVSDLPKWRRKAKKPGLLTDLFLQNNKRSRMHKEFFELLHKDHESFRNILLQLKQIEGTESKRREELFSDS